MTPNLFLTFNLFMSRMAGWKGIYILLLGEEEGCIKKYFEGTSKKKRMQCWLLNVAIKQNHNDYVTALAYPILEGHIG